MFGAITFSHSIDPRRVAPGRVQRTNAPKEVAPVSNTKIRFTTANQSRIVMPTYATAGVLACAWTDAPVRKHVTGSFTGTNPGTHVWSPPTC